MEVKELIISQKQKRKRLDGILSSFCSEIKSRKKKISVYKSYLLKFYDALVGLPYPFQMFEAKKWIAAVSESGIENSVCTYNDLEKKALDYITVTASSVPDFNKEISNLKNMISNDKDEIKRILRSKRFEIGRRLTKKNDSIRIL